MSQEELARLAELEAELAEKLRQVRAQRLDLAEKLRLEQEAEAKRKELETFTQFLVSKADVNGRYPHVCVVNRPMRSDLVEFYRGIPGRQWERYAKHNTIPLKSWTTFLERVDSVPNSELIYENGVKEQIEEYLSAPAWTVKIDESRDNRPFRVNRGPSAEDWPHFNTIPGCKQESWSVYSWIIPRQEGWRIPKLLINHGEVKFSPEAIEEIERQINRRAKLDAIAQDENADDPRINKYLTRVVWKNGNFVPFCDALYHYQKVGVAFLLENGGRMLVGDDTGLGKTWEFLAYSEILRLSGEISQTLIAVKPANLENWRREIRNLTGEEAIVCKTGKPEGHVIKAVALDRAPYVLISIDTLALYNEVGTGEFNEQGKEKKDKVFTWPQIFSIKPPDLMGIDEAQQIKNSSTYRFRSIRLLEGIERIIPMTATPVINRTGEFYTILHMIDPVVFNSEQRFLDDYTYMGEPKNVEQLKELLRPIFIRRQKKDVFKDLPPINRMYEYRELSEKATRVYKKILMGIYESLATFDPRGMGGDDMNIMSILAQITRLKQVCASDMVPHTAEFAQGIMDSHENGGKMLIFSHFKATAYRISQLLGSEAVCTVKRTENSFDSLTAPKRDALFEEARRDPQIKYLVTTEAAKEGHNLEFCDWVVFNDFWWTPAGHIQAEGRAYGRASNPHPIDAYYVVASVQIVEWIRELLARKLAIIDAAVEGVEASRETQGSIANELINKIWGAMKKGEIEI